MRLLTILMVCLFGSTVLAQRGERAERATPPRGEARMTQMREQLHELRERLHELRQSAHELRRPTKQQAERVAPPQRGAKGANGAKGQRGARAEAEGRPQSRSQQPRRPAAALRGRGGDERARHDGAPFQRRHAQPMPIRMRMQMLRQRAEALREAAQHRGGDERRHAAPGRKGGRSGGFERGAEPRPRHRSVIR